MIINRTLLAGVNEAVALAGGMLAGEGWIIAGGFESGTTDARAVVVP